MKPLTLIALFGLCIFLLSTKAGCSDPDIGEEMEALFDLSSISSFAITKVGDVEVENGLVAPLTCDASICQKKVLGNITGIIEGQFIAVYLREINSNSFQIQSSSISFRQDGSWERTIQLGSVDNPPQGKEFELVGLVSGYDLSNYAVTDNIDKDIPTHLKTNFILLTVEN